tara:strand:+ start:1232 stop:1519 length:288 start_codon:yes stop_codon:yes gene_type:complete
MLISDTVASEIKSQFPECLQAKGMALSFLTYSAVAKELESMQANNSLAYAASVAWYGDAGLWIIAYELFIAPPAAGNIATLAENTENNTKAVDTF